MFIRQSKQFSHAKIFNVAICLYLHRRRAPAFIAVVMEAQTIPQLGCAIGRLWARVAQIEMTYNWTIAKWKYHG